MTSEIEADLAAGNAPQENFFRLMLFDLSISGHHPSYIKHLIHYCQTQKLAIDLIIVVSPKFLEEHGDVVELSNNANQKNIKFIAITLEEESALKSRDSGFSRLSRSFQEWQIFCHYAQSLHATQALLLYFDTFQPPIALGFDCPCPFSGIYFRPTLHYRDLTHYEFSWKEWLQKWRERITLSRVLKHRQLQYLFCLDSLAIQPINQLFGTTKLIDLADPVETCQNSALDPEQLRSKLGIEGNRKVFLLFGSLTERKGIYQLLAAISCLEDNQCQEICLLLVGESSIQAELEKYIETLCQAKPVQILRRYEFVPDEDIPAYLQVSDIVLALYQKHVGMSGILLLGAAAQKPVLSSNYGLMGELVKRHHLGLTVDSTCPEQIAQAVTFCLQHPPESLGDLAGMKTFAEQNTPQQFASTIFQSLCAVDETKQAIQSPL